MDFVSLGKEKRYDLHPHLLDIHIKRMLAANEVCKGFMCDTELLRSGLVRFENFVGADLAEKIAQEILDCKIKDGRSQLTQLVNRVGMPSYSAMERLWDTVSSFYKEDVQKRVRFTFEDRSYLQHLVNEPEDRDEQKVFHSDTFFHCVKFWYFPQAVWKDDGPFWYVPYSPELTPRLIAWHEARVDDLKAGKSEEWRGQGHREGSFRISPEEIEKLGLFALPVCVPADTLVVANVFGFHRRGDVKEAKHRVAIHGSLRFSPW